MKKNLDLKRIAKFNFTVWKIWALLENGFGDTSEKVQFLPAFPIMQSQITKPNTLQ